jgi:hypothetical protein
MILPDGRYATLVAFVEGYNCAMNGAALLGFHDWVADVVLGRSCSIYWPFIIASKYMPELLDESQHGHQIPANLDSQLCSELFDLLDRFLAETSSD